MVYDSAMTPVGIAEEFISATWTRCVRAPSNATLRVPVGSQAAELLLDVFRAGIETGRAGAHEDLAGPALVQRAARIHPVGKGLMIAQSVHSSISSCVI